MKGISYKDTLVSHKHKNTQARKFILQSFPCRHDVSKKIALKPEGYMQGNVTATDGEQQAHNTVSSSLKMQKSLIL